MELDTTDMEARVLLAQVYQEQENFDQAMSVLEPLVQKDSTNCSVLQQLSIIYAKKGMGEKAKATWQKAQDCLESQK
jgi:cytochrome c-type biogenesis protein CcmH/NrfG